LKAPSGANNDTIITQAYTVITHADALSKLDAKWYGKTLI